MLYRKQMQYAALMRIEGLTKDGTVCETFQYEVISVFGTDI